MAGAAAAGGAPFRDDLVARTGESGQTLKERAVEKVERDQAGGKKLAVGMAELAEMVGTGSIQGIGPRCWDIRRSCARARTGSRNHPPRTAAHQPTRRPSWRRPSRRRGALTSAPMGRCCGPSLRAPHSIRGCHAGTGRFAAHEAGVASTRNRWRTWDPPLAGRCRTVSGGDQATSDGFEKAPPACMPR